MIRLLGAILLAAAIAWSENTTRQVRSGKYEVTLRPPVTGIIAGEEIQIEFRVVDATQADPISGPLPIVRAKIGTRIHMPEMPGMPARIETAHPEGVPGDYGIHPTFPHGGVYRLSISVDPPGGEPFSLEFPLSVLDRAAIAGRKLPPPRFRLDLAAEPKTPKAGEPADLRIVVRDRDTPGQNVTQFETVHEKWMHLVIVSKDLRSFRHEHPEMTPDGTFKLQHLFPSAGEYHLFADVAPKNAGAHVLFAKLKVGGKSSPTPPIAALSLRGASEQTEVEVRPTASPIPTKKTEIVPVSFRDRGSGQPATDLENYLGAKAHLILIHEDALTFVHCHPYERASVEDSNGIVPFLVRLPRPGTYHGWLQFVRHGMLNTVELMMEGAAN